MTIAIGVLLLALLGVWSQAKRDRGHLEQGIELFQRGFYADAAHHFWRYAENHPNELAPQLYLARIHRRMDRPDLAAQAIRKAQRISPDNPRVQAILSELSASDTGAVGASPPFPRDP